ncbi:MAG: GNAT family N-acetyltransferase [Eudoraea sp.]
MTIKIVSFSDLTKKELYKILQLRAEVFIVEQNCVYQDIDDKDEKAMHLLAYKNNTIIAYTRLFKAHDYMDCASIGRVVVRKDYRKHGYGEELMRASIQGIKDIFKETTIKVSAQLYLRKFYNDLGFVQLGETYQEDGIPHILMIRKEED